MVAIFRSLEGESLEDYSIRLAQAWRIGQKGLDNGVIFLVFVDDRKMRIEVGYGLESKLTDALSSQILRQDVAPRFREGKIGDGIAAGLDRDRAGHRGHLQGGAAGPGSPRAGAEPLPDRAPLLRGERSLLHRDPRALRLARQAPGLDRRPARLGRPHHLSRRRLGRRWGWWRRRRRRRLRGRRRRLRRRRRERRLVMARHPKWVRALLSEDDLAAVTRAVAEAERHTSAEVRVHLDHSCEGDALQQAIKVFERLGMHKTAERNGVLVYISVTDRKLAVIGDKGIHERVGEAYWQGTGRRRPRADEAAAVARRPHPRARGSRQRAQPPLSAPTRRQERALRRREPRSPIRAHQRPGVEKGPDARRRPKAAGEAYSCLSQPSPRGSALSSNCHEPAAEGAPDM